MQRSLILTKDGSHTVAVPEMNVTYHSVHGAMQESLHIFIEAGLKNISSTGKAPISIFEMGFGTGLNALLTIIEAERMQRPVHYTTIEPYPLEPAQFHSLNYCQQLNRPDLQPVFDQFHESEWEKELIITDYFNFRKLKVNLIGFSVSQFFDLIYFDAFAPEVQPEIWSTEIFEKLYSLLNPGGMLLTYCSKSNVRKAMQAAGLKVEKIPGPRGKREIVRAFKAEEM